MTSIEEALHRGPITVSYETSVEEAERLLSELRVPALPVVDARGRVVGLITEASLRPGPLSVADVVADVMVLIDDLPTEDANIAEVAQAMLVHQVAVLPVVYRGSRHLAGVVSDRDLLRALSRLGRDPDDASDSDEPVSRSPNIDAICAELEQLRTERGRRKRRWRHPRAGLRRG